MADSTMCQLYDITKLVPDWLVRRHVSDMERFYAALPLVEEMSAYWGKPHAATALCEHWNASQCAEYELAIEQMMAMIADIAESTGPELLAGRNLIATRICNDIMDCYSELPEVRHG